MGNRVENMENRDPEGPTEEEIAEVNNLRGPIQKNRWIAGAAAALGLPFLAAGCAPSCGPVQEVKPAPTTSSSQPFATAEIAQKPEVAQEKPGIYITTFTQETMPADLVKELNAPIDRMLNIKAIDPQNVKNTAEFYSAKTKDGKEHIAFKGTDGKFVVLPSYDTAAVADLKTGKVSVDYMETQKYETFFSLGLDRVIAKNTGESDQQYKSRVTAQLQNTEYKNQIKADLDAAAKIKTVTIANLLTGQKVVFDLEKNPDMASQILAALSPQTAYAAEVKTMSPAPVEKPTSLNSKNLNQFAEKISSDDIQTLAKDKPNDFAFPFVSNSQDTQITYNSMPVSDIAAKSEYKEIVAQGTEIEFFPPAEGEIIFSCTNRKEPDRITTIRIKKTVSANTSYIISLTVLSDFQIAGNIIPTIEELTETKAPAGKELHGKIQAGQLAAKIKGQAALTIALIENLDQPKKITNSDGSIRTFSSYTTYVTPEIFNAQTGTSNNWLRTADGKIAIPQN